MSGKTLRLIYPQFQGGWPQSIADCLNNQFSIEDATFGYWLGSQIMNIIAPKVDGPTCEVPINTDQSAEALKDEKGIHARKTILNHLNAAMKIMNEQNPERILVLGGECSVCLAPFSYTANKYGSENIAMVYIDSHPDLIIPGDTPEPQGFNEMPIPHLFGMGDEDVLKTCPGRILPKNTIYVGLRVCGDIEKNRMKELGGIKILSPEEFSLSSKL